MNEEQKLCIIVCDNFAPEIIHIINSESYPDVTVKSFYSLCNSSNLIEERVDQIINESGLDYSNTIFIGCPCALTKKGEIGEKIKSEIVQLEQSFELLISKEMIEHFVSKKYYLVSSGWLKSYKRHIKDWGFEPDIAKRFFGEIAQKIMFLDTGLPGDFLPQIKDLSDYTGLPFEILPIGLSHCKVFLDSIISKWREERERITNNERLAAASSRAADYALVFNEINRLVELTDEKEIINKISYLINLLFAPKEIKYKPNNKDKYEKFDLMQKEEIESERSQNKSFIIVLHHDGEKLGVFELIEIPFPQYINKYKEISKIIGSIGGLALANARKFEMISTKNKFFAIISHDLKSPFQGILNITELMAESAEMFSASEIAEQSISLNKTARNFYKLLEDLLTWAKTQAGSIDYSPLECNLYYMVSRNIDTINQRAQQKGITILNEIDGKLGVSADEKMFDTILRNLLSNAVKFTKRDGKISVKSDLGNDGMVKICITDNGVGIKQDDLNRLFKIGEKVSTKGTDGESSTGLGLLLCKEFVERHGGRIWAESVLNEGSTFCFTLPLVV